MGFCTRRHCQGVGPVTNLISPSHGDMGTAIMTTVYKRLKLETEMTTLDAQNSLQRLTNDALREGHKVIRILSSDTDRNMRTRRLIEEVRVCAGGQN